MVLLVFVTLGARAGVMDWLSPDIASPPPSGGGVDMSATFAKLRTCSACTGAGYGWCPNRRKCGGFANKECGVGENYVAEGHVPGFEATTKKPNKPKKASPSPPKRRRTPPASPPASGGGVDMRATFAKLVSAEGFETPSRPIWSEVGSQHHMR